MTMCCTYNRRILWVRLSRWGIKSALISLNLRNQELGTIYSVFLISLNLFTLFNLKISPVLV